MARSQYVYWVTLDSWYTGRPQRTVFTVLREALSYAHSIETDDVARIAVYGSQVGYGGGARLVENTDTLRELVYLEGT